MRMLRALRLCFLISVAAAAPFSTQGFSFTAVSNRIVTPNGDGKNDTVEISFQNPQASQVTGKIYDARGAAVAAMGTCPDSPIDSCLMWDAKSNGQVVRSGLYIYVIEAESKAFRGAVLVVR